MHVFSQIDVVTKYDSKLGVIPINPLNISDHRRSSIDIILQDVNQIEYGFSEQGKYVIFQPENLHKLNNSGKSSDLEFVD